MHNFIKAIAPALLIAVLLASCGNGVQLHSVDKSYSTDTIFADAKIPQLSGLSSESLQDSVNEEYEKTITELLNNFSKEAKNTGDQSTFTVTTTQHLNANGFFSVVTQVDSCTHSAHKNSFRITKNIDTAACVEVRLSDLFSDDSYIDMINSRLEEEIKQNPDKYSDLWEKPKLSENQKFYINEKNLVLFYPPYELSYYERGFVEIPLSLADMSGYLKSDYQRLAGN
ncbi:MAG: DUF3298 domain-containing protein [Clostridia bacterium]|nr:DUF3298 domain-containing protein [Clostridia bacterium]